MGPILDTSTLGVDANTDDDSVTVSDADDPGTARASTRLWV
jgi:hypothetical protein